MFRWVEIGLENATARYEFLQKFLAEQGFANSVEFIKVTPETAIDVIKESLKKFDGIRLGRGCGEVVFQIFTHLPFLVDRIRAADSLVKMKDRWWPEANAVEGFRHILVRNGKILDLGGSALVVGSGAAAKVALTSLFMAGFRNFGVSSLDVKKVESMVMDLRKSHLGAQIEVIPKESLILLPGTYNAMVNTTPMNQDNPMMVELNYFNFFKSGGFAADFSILPVETFFLKGAAEIGATCIYGYQVSAQTDMIWAGKIMGRSPGNSLLYEEKLGEIIRKS